MAAEATTTTTLTAEEHSPQSLLRHLGTDDNHRASTVLHYDNKIFNRLFFGEHSVELLRYMLSGNFSVYEFVKTRLRQKYQKDCLNEDILPKIIHSAEDIIFLADTFPAQKNILSIALLNNSSVFSKVASSCNHQGFAALTNLSGKDVVQFIQLGTDDTERLAILLTSDDKFTSIFFDSHSVRLLRYILSGNCSATAGQKTALRDKYLQHCLNEGILPEIIHSAEDIIFLAVTFPDKRDLVSKILINNRSVSSKIVSGCHYESFLLLIEHFHQNVVQVIQLFFGEGAIISPMIRIPDLFMINDILIHCEKVSNLQNQTAIKEILFKHIISYGNLFNYLKNYEALKLFIEIFPDKRNFLALIIFTKYQHRVRIVSSVRNGSNGDYLPMLYTLFPNHKDLIDQSASITKAYDMDNGQYFTKLFMHIVEETENGNLRRPQLLVILNNLKTTYIDRPNITEALQNIFPVIANTQSDREEMPTLLTSCLRQMPPHRFRFFGSTQRIFDLSILPTELQELYRSTWRAVGVRFDLPETSNVDKANNADRSSGEPAR